ncbi:uncharacterized protein PG986_011182 [Apiospora aurea]|uniref:Aminoglycoside phosphotransferase domain-containing protein n=1 Tax=Apiospora aurea TaxID=335848 RepID=A0ABR1Q4D7_9PEZI
MGLMELPEDCNRTASQLWRMGVPSLVPTLSEEEQDGICRLLDSEEAEGFPRSTALCQQLWPSAIAGTINIEFLSDGACNHVFSLSLSEMRGDRALHHDLVIHIPTTRASIPQSAAILQYLKKYTKLKIPEVVTWDATNDNPLGFSYLILSRLPGKAMSSMWKDLTHEGKLIIAAEMASLYRQLESFTSPVAGSIEVQPKEARLSPSNIDDHVVLKVFGAKHSSQPDDLDRWLNSGDDMLPLHRLRQDPADLAMSDILLAVLQRQIYHGCAAVDMYGKIQKKIQRMVADGLISSSEEIHDKKICLRHPDLFPRNILVDIDEKGDPFISGVVDWDHAWFVPRFAARVVPEWLWDHRQEFEGSYDSQSTESGGPDSPENQQIMEAFEDAVGEDWMDEALGERFTYLRTLF